MESENRDRFFTPILVVSAFTIAALVTVMAAHQIKEHRRKKRGSGLPEIGAEQYGGKTSLVYQDLCRHQMSSRDPTSATEPHSKHSSSSSWFVKDFLIYKTQISSRKYNVKIEL